MSASDDALARFIDITSTSPAQAQFYLDSAGGDLDVAVAQFFESGGNDDAAVSSAELPGSSAGAPRALGQPTSAPAAAAPQQSGAYTLSGAPVEAMPAGWGSGGGSGSAGGSGRSTPRNPLRSNTGPRITGFRDLASASGPSGGPSFGGRGGGGDDSDDDEGRDPQHFFAGGAKSGLSVENPDDQRRGGGGGMGDMIRGILEQARQGSQRLAGGGEEEGAQQSGSRFFGGSAHTLGSDETPSTYIPDPTHKEDQENDEPEEEQETAIRHLTFWQDGFSIEDGDLMKYEEHQELLAAIQSGRAPLSLLKVSHDQPVELRIAERRSEKWVRQPPPPQGPWSGTGNRLGSVSPFPDSAGAGAAPSGTMPGTFAGGSGSGTRQAGASSGGGESAGGQTVFEVDRNEPTTQVQVRLRNGERMIATFNHTHTVGDIRQYINSSSPQNAGSYVLQTTFPTRDLTDDKQTIEEAGLKGSVVVQRPV
ncbi:hypothetical protein JCM11251_006856 [Rhodosporidiobolus azoricus]